MAYCSNCGAEVNDDQYVCIKCGHKINNVVKKDNGGMKIAVKVFLIVACVIMGLYIIPLAWCIPMTVSICNNLKNDRPVSTGMKVCTLLFVSIIAGILLLCINDD